VERLVMLFSGTRRISDCLSFGNLRNVVGLSAVGAKSTAELDKAREKGEESASTSSAHREGQ
jgi:lysyl-tRNA synthetase class 2